MNIDKDFEKMLICCLNIHQLDKTDYKMYCVCENNISFTFRENVSTIYFDLNDNKFMRKTTHGYGYDHYITKLNDCFIEITRIKKLELI